MLIPKIVFCLLIGLPRLYFAYRLRNMFLDPLKIFCDLFNLVVVSKSVDASPCLGPVRARCLHGRSEGGESG